MMNCGSTEHNSLRKNCGAYQKEKEIVGIKTSQKISFIEARRLYALQNPLHQQRFSDVLRPKRCCSECHAGRKAKEKPEDDIEMTEDERCLLNFASESRETNLTSSDDMENDEHDKATKRKKNRKNK